MIRVLIADKLIADKLIADNKWSTRAGVKAELAADHKFEIVGEVEDIADLQRVIALKQPDVVLLDVLMLGDDAASRVRDLRTSHPSLRILIFTTDGQPRTIQQMQQVGAHGYLLLCEDQSLLKEAVRAIAGGRIWFSPKAAASRDAVLLGPTLQPPELTEREAKFLQLVADEKTNREIGLEMHMSKQAVDKELQKMFEKLNVKTRQGAVAVALRAGLIR